MLQTENFYQDYAYLKKLGNSFKLIKCNTVKQKGIEKIDIITQMDSFSRRVGYRFEKFDCSRDIANFSCSNSANEKVKDSTNDEKLSNNICRARNKILEYVLCNDFVFFVTLTLDKNKYKRDDLGAFIKGWKDFVKNYNSRKNASIKYLLIPETHEDGSWHMHGFIMGLPYDRLELFDLYGVRPLPPYIVNKLKKNELVYNFPEYEKRFGYNVIEPIRNKKASVLYMSKYLTKDISRNVTELGNHLYYCSKGLNKAEIIKQGQFLDCDYQFDFKNEYGGQSFFDFLDDVQLEELKNKIGNTPITLDDYRRGYRVNNGWYEFCDTDTGEILSNGYSEICG